MFVIRERIYAHPVYKIRILWNINEVYKNYMFICYSYTNYTNIQFINFIIIPGFLAFYVLRNTRQLFYMLRNTRQLFYMLRNTCQLFYVT